MSGCIGLEERQVSEQVVSLRQKVVVYAWIVQVVVDQTTEITCVGIEGGDAKQRLDRELMLSFDQSSRQASLYIILGTLAFELQEALNICECMTWNEVAR